LSHAILLIGTIFVPVHIRTSMLLARVAASLLSPKDVWAQVTAAGVLYAVGLAASFNSCVSREPD
jgi:hypothetical protein